MQRLMSGEVPVERMAEMMAPKVVDGRWRKPELSRRLVAKVRKAWALDGREWPFEEKPRTNYGGWKVQDLPQVKQKGKKVDREKIDRYATLGRDDPSAAALPDGVTNEQTFSLLSSSRFSPLQTKERRGEDEGHAEAHRGVQREVQGLAALRRDVSNRQDFHDAGTAAQEAKGSAELSLGDSDSRHRGLQNCRIIGFTILSCAWSSCPLLTSTSPRLGGKHLRSL